MHSQRQGAQEIRIRMQSKLGDNIEAVLDSGDRGQARQSIRWSNAQGSNLADGAVERNQAERSICRSRLQRQRSSSRRSRCLHFRTKRIESWAKEAPETPVSD